MKEKILEYLRSQKVWQKRRLEITDKHDYYGQGYRDGALETLRDFEEWAKQLDENDLVSVEKKELLTFLRS